MNRDNKSKSNLPPINNKIRYKTLRVIDNDGSTIGIISKEEALQIAQEKGLDLVMISEKADPPVCKVMDFGKYKYEQGKKQKEAKKKQHNAEVKEVKLSYKIAKGDYDVRVKNATKFLNGGDKVKATVNLRGRETQHSNLAKEILLSMAEDLKDFGEVQQQPKQEGRRLIMMLSPKKTTS